jgi:ABC-type multidrug transport system fused ATPase/permease subunit
MLGLQNKEFQEWYFQKFTNMLGIENKIKFHEIDFDKPWWQVYSWTKIKNIAVLLTVIGESSFLTALPLILIHLIKNPDLNNYLIVIIVALVITVFFTIGYFLSTIWECIISNNIANSYFLKVDPIYHTTKNSGQIIAKIERATIAYLDFDIGIVFDVLPNLIAITVGSIALFVYDIRIGFVGLLSSLIILFLSVYLRVFNNLVFRSKVIETEDISKSLTVENLSQMIYIRAAFATNEQTEQSGTLSKKSAAIRANF